MKSRKVGIFLSFEFGKDNNLHQSFYSQSKQHSKYDIIDYSLNESYHPDNLWLNKARKQIEQSDLVIVMLGEDTHNAPGVIKEVGEANKLNKPMFQLKPNNRTSGIVAGAGDVIRWKWKQIDVKIESLLQFTKENIKQ